MYIKQKEYTEKKGLSFNSKMISGCEWDQIMIWLKDIKNSRGTDARSYFVLHAFGMRKIS